MEIYEKTPEVFYLSANVISNNISFKPAFKEWNNFDQTVITDKNLSGTAEAALEFRAPFDLRSGVILNEIEAKLKLKVYNGHLKDVASFKDIIASIRTKAGKLVLGNNNINEFEKKLNDLSFETLENTIIINKGVIQLPNMKIVSSAMEMDVSGTHTFENIVDYRFAFSLRDIKQQNNTTEFGQIIDDQTGFRVFMRMHGSLDNPIIEWDKKAKSEQKKENINEAKQDAKSILKSEFGLFKKDSMVNVYIPKEQPKEDIKINFNPKVKVEKTPNKPPIIEAELPKKDTKIKKVFKNWKDQQEEEEKNLIKVNNGKG
jgi:tRNA splicing endonuclease